MSLKKAAASAATYCFMATPSTTWSQILPLPFSAWAHTSRPSFTMWPKAHQSPSTGFGSPACFMALA